MSNKLLRIDAAINFLLGILLLFSIPFPQQLSAFLGVPTIEQGFYPSILGGVLIGIGIGLLLESNRQTHQQMVGLGLAGAIGINLCGGVVLLGWLLFGNLNLPLRGLIFLWVVDFILVGISSVELITLRIRQTTIK
jgi:hypothetical protein